MARWLRTACSRIGTGRRFSTATTTLHSASRQTLGFIGLGQMGARMARNLIEKSPEGSQLLLHDVNRQASKALAKEIGAAHDVKVAESVAQVAESCQVVVTMLPASKHVEHVYLGPGGMVESYCAMPVNKSADDKAIWIDASTVAPETSQKVYEAARPRVISVDAPVSGGVGGAEAGTLTFMVGAESAPVFAAVEPILKRMGAKVVHCGKSGSGQGAKLCNNLLLGISMLGTAEAMRLGEHLGLSPTMLAGILNTSTGRCWSSEVYNPVPGVVPTAPSSRDYAGGFGVSLMAKDLGLAAEAAEKKGAVLSLGAIARFVYDEASASDRFRGKDFSVVYEWLKSQEHSADK